MKNYLSFEEAVRWIAHCKGRPPEHDDNFLDLIKLLEDGLVTASGRKAGSPTTEFVAIEPAIWADTKEEGEGWWSYSDGDERSTYQLYHSLSLVSWPNHGASTGAHGGRFAHREMDLPGTLTINTHHGALLTAPPTFTGLRIRSDELAAKIAEDDRAHNADSTSLSMESVVSVTETPAGTADPLEIPALQLDVLRAHDELERDGKLPINSGDKTNAIIARLKESGCRTPSGKTVRRALKNRHSGTSKDR